MVVRLLVGSGESRKGSRIHRSAFLPIILKLKRRTIKRTALLGLLYHSVYFCSTAPPLALHTPGTAGSANPQLHHGSVPRRGLGPRSTSYQAEVISCGR